ncbi:MAG: 50S ribosomal protein L5 [Methermicoccaceae archaeon]
METSTPKPKDANPMRGLKVDKIVVHMCTGESGQMLVNAETILSQLTGRKPIRSMAKKTLPAFEIRKNEPISIRVTLRGKEAEEFLRKSLAIVEREIKFTSFDDWGNFAFGIEEHTDFPGMVYDPNIGIYGMDVMVSLARPGYRVMRRKITRSKVGKNHRVRREDAINYLTEHFDMEVV